MTTARTATSASTPPPALVPHRPPDQAACRRAHTAQCDRLALVPAGIVPAQTASQDRVGILAEDGATVPLAYAEDPLDAVTDGFAAEHERVAPQPAA